MPNAERSSLFHKLDETRLSLEDLLLKIDITKYIYPGWTIKEILAHMTGWDDVSIDSLRAHVVGQHTSLDAIHSINGYNKQSINSRAHLDYDQVLKEWRLTRKVLRTLIEQMSEEKFLEPFIVPWGGTTTVTSMVNLFHDHEEEHIHDIRKWMRHPDHPLEKEGK